MQRSQRQSDTSVRDLKKDTRSQDSDDREGEVQGIGLGDRKSHDGGSREKTEKNIEYRYHREWASEISEETEQQMTRWVEGRGVDHLQRQNKRSKRKKKHLAKMGRKKVNQMSQGRKKNR